jgi:hypothetical protein
MAPRSAPPAPAWAVTPAAAAAAAGVDPDAGLSAAEADARRARFGPNELARDPPTPMWRLVLAQFDDMLVKVSQTGVCVGVGGCRSGLGWGARGAAHGAASSDAAFFFSSSIIPQQAALPAAHPPLDPPLELHGRAGD